MQRPLGTTDHRHISLIAALAGGLAALTATADMLAPLRAANAGLRREVLGNGLVCLVKADPAAKVAHVQIWIGRGSADEGEFLGAGLSHAVEHMVFKGTPTRPAAQMTREIDEAGGSVNAYTTREQVVLHADIPAGRWRTAVEVLADTVRNASFPAGEWEKEREVILREFAMGRDDPERELDKLLWQTAYRVHPYGTPVIGHEDIFRRLQREDVATLFQRHYGPDGMIAVAVGAFDADEVMAALRAAFEGFERRPRSAVALPPEPPQVSRREARQTGAWELARLAWAVHTTPLLHPDTPALDVLAVLAGHGRSGHLPRELKEQRGLVHHVSAWSFTPRAPGLFTIEATFAPQREGEVRHAIDALVRTWGETLFPLEQLEKARRQILVQELEQLETAAGQARAHAAGEFYSGDPFLTEQYLADVLAVDAEAVQRVAQRYLDPARATVVVLAPAEALAGTAEPGDAPTVGAVQRHGLDEGARALTREDRRLPFVTFCVAIGGGQLAEADPNDAGLSRLLSELLPRGTPEHDAETIARLVEERGATLSAFSGRNSFGLQGRCLTPDAEFLADLIGACIASPAIPEDQLALQRELQLAALAREREDPMEVAFHALGEQVFGAHPYAQSRNGNETALRAAGRDNVLAMHRRLVVRGNVVVSVFGDRDTDAALALAERILADIPAGAPPAAPPAPAQREAATRLERTDPRAQAVVWVGFPGLALDDPNADALRVAERALSGLSSDLALELRERRGLVYFCGAAQVHGLQPGLFALYAGTHTEAVQEVASLLEAEARRLQEGGLRADEIERARRQLVAERRGVESDNRELAQAAALDELYGLGFDHGEQIEQRLEALTPERVRAVTEATLAPTRRYTVILRPATE